MVFKSEVVQTIVDLQKKGTFIFLTDEGHLELLKLIQKEDFFKEVEQYVEQSEAV